MRERTINIPRYLISSTHEMTVIYLDSQLTLLAAANKPLATIRSTS